MELRPPDIRGTARVRPDEPNRTATMRKPEHPFLVCRLGPPVVSPPAPRRKRSGPSLRASTLLDCATMLAFLLSDVLSLLVDDIGLLLLYVRRRLAGSPNVSGR